MPAGRDGVVKIISAAVTELVESKRLGGRRKVYLDELKRCLLKFSAGRESASLADFTVQDIESWLAQFPGSWSRHTWLSRISTLFCFAVRRGWIDKNPCAQVERVFVDKKPPQILTIEQVEILLRECPPTCKAWLVLALFAGVRPDGELMRVTWEDVDLATATVKINFPKVRKHRRIVPLPARAVALLRECVAMSGLVAPSRSTLRRFKRRVCAALGFVAWPQDVLRHTAASYLLANNGDVGKVATMLGNTPGILLTHYHSPVTTDAAANFFRV